MGQTVRDVFSENTYPGRGIIIGRSADNLRAVIVYFIMGRSENSRNRVFEATDDGIRTKAYDPAKLTDPSLVIYHPVREINGETIVTNGDQTDTIRDCLQSGGSFYDAVLSRVYEPDPPIWTPRISGMLSRNGGYRLAIVKNVGGEKEVPVHCIYEYTVSVPGTGHFIRTYERDGNPPLPFSGEPVEIDIDLSGGLETYVQSVWDALNENNRVSLYVREVELSTGDCMEIIINRHGE